MTMREAECEGVGLGGGVGWRCCDKISASSAKPTLPTEPPAPGISSALSLDWSALRNQKYQVSFPESNN